MYPLALVVVLAILLSFGSSNAWSFKLHSSIRKPSPPHQNNTILHSATSPIATIHIGLHDVSEVPLVSPSSLQNSESKKIFASIVILGLGAVLLTPRAALAGLKSIFHSFIPSRDTAFMQSFLLVFLSELGDKTFFMAALLAAKYGKLIAFSGAMSALLMMTIISTAIGQLFRRVPKSFTNGFPYNDCLAAIAFGFFGIKLLWETWRRNDSSDRSGMDEEKAEAEEIVGKVEKKSNAISLVIQIFSLVFAAEVGDRSFLSTIALSSTVNPLAVAVGALSAHGMATGIAVIGGTIISKYLSEKAIALFGGFLFLFFSVTSALGLL